MSRYSGPVKPTMIRRFAGRWEFLSNFYPCAIMYAGDLYPSVEHAYQAAKTMVAEEREQIRCAQSPGTAKRVGQRVTLRPGWDRYKVNIMRDLLIHKFTNHQGLRTMLLATGNAKLVEGNYWGDRFWGVDMATGEGENWLGCLLMETRACLQGAVKCPLS